MSKRTPSASLFLWGSVLCGALGASPVYAQSHCVETALVVSAPSPYAQGLLGSRGFRETEASLIIDASGGRIRVETSSAGPVLDIPFDAVTGIHYEESRYPPRFLGRRGFYLTVHHTGSRGEAEVAILRLPSRTSAEDCLARIERDTPLRVDRRPATASFQGLPIHAFVGTVVYVTDDTGRRTKGTIAEFQPSAIRLAEGGRFEEASIRRIDVSDSVLDGAAQGALLGILPAVLITGDHCGSESCSTFGRLSAGGWAAILGGGAVGALLDSQVMRHAYRRPKGSASAPVLWMPIAEAHTAGVRLVIQF
jgi:hypothetical protein